MSLLHGDPELARAMANVRSIGRRNFLIAGAAAATGALIPAGGASAEAAKAAAEVTEQDRQYMAMALDRMREAGVINKTGGPFGAVLVLDGKILAVAGNSVTRDSDPSAHAEVNALREACRKIGRPHVDGAVLYSSCEPCPMCYSVAYWARVGKIFYGASYADYGDLFDDSNIANDLNLPYGQRHVAVQQIMRPEAQKVWEEFRQLPDGARY